MGLMDKFKKILFDEEEINVPVNDSELPERTPKKEKKEEAPRGFRDYNGGELLEEKDTIVEVKVPKEEPILDKEPENKGFNLPIDFDMEEELPARRRSFDDTEEYVIGERKVEKYRQPEIKKSAVESRRDYRELSRVVETPKRHEEVKDYKKIVSEKEDTTFKKPFRVTPIISPVFGILDKNYTPDEVVERREQINRVNNNVSKPRTFGPVSYNDQPLPKNSSTSSKRKLSEELVELNSTISDLMEEPIDNNDTREIAITRTEIKVNEQPVMVSKVVEQTVKPVANLEDTEPIIMTPNYDEYETSSIEEKYIGNNNIEDAFESTNEFKEIHTLDSSVEQSTPQPSIEEIINNADNYEEENNNLDDTIETDLFNLIDSMYNNKNDELDEDSED